MKRSIPVRLAALAISSLLLGACGTLDYRKQVAEEVETIRTGPQARPTRSITGFTDSLRCMDSMLAAYGVRDVPILVEDIQDATKKVTVGGRDMLISAINELSARSQSVRLITFGPDVANLANFLANAEAKTPYASVPVYDIRGSISQLDEGLFKKQAEAGITIDLFGIGAAKTGDGSILALDLSVISARDYSLVPGAKANNSVLIYKEGAGVDGEASYRKLGINFGLTLTRNEGKSQAARSLIELAVIELIGKLAKVPYWTCLGAEASNPEVKHEITTYLYSMQANEELVGYFQKQMTLRGVYDGPIDGESNDAFVAALIELRRKHKLSAEAVIDIELLTAYLSTDYRTGAPLRVAFNTPAATAPAAAASSAAKADLRLELLSGASSFKPGDNVKLTAVASANANLYCYLQDAGRRIVRFYPNRFTPSPAIAAGKAVQIPGQMRFQISAPTQGKKEIVACFAVTQDVTKHLPPEVFANDFEPMKVQSLDQIHAAFTKTTQGAFALGVVHVESK